MSQFLSHLLDQASEYFAQRKGLLPILGMTLVILNLIVRFLPLGWFSASDLLLHLGIVVTIVGLLLSWSL